MIQVSEVSDPAAFSALAGEWNALALRTQDEVNHRHEFLSAVAKNYFAGKNLRILLGRDQEGRLVAALPLVEEKASVYGIPVLRVTSISTWSFSRFDMIAEDPAEAGRAFFQHMRAGKRWNMVQLNDVPEGAAAWHFLRAAQEAGYPAGALEGFQTPYILLPKTFDEVKSRLRQSFHSRNRRKRNKLQQKGKVTLEKVTGGPSLLEKVEEGYAVENRNWKGAGGTSILQKQADHNFFNELAQAASREGYLALHFLRVGGVGAAFAYSLIYKKKYLFLKIGYDAAYKESSPGHLLTEDLVKEAIAQGLEEFDFLGVDMPWKSEWADRKRVHSWLVIFPDNMLGRFLYFLKFSCAPFLKKIVRRPAAASGNG